MTKNDPRKALGKGLHSLLPGRPTSAYVPEKQEPEPPKEGSVSMIPLDQVVPNVNQPRRDFDPQAMSELTQSVERDGIIQPIIARQTSPTEYQIIAGERRWRAARAAGLQQVPVIIRTADDQQVLELAIIENIQREDLNPVELAIAFQRMQTELHLSHDQIGEKTGKDRVTITNTIRLLQLPVYIQELIAAKRLSSGHGRALLKLQDEDAQKEMAQRSIEEGWSVRQMEEFTRPVGATGKARPVSHSEREKAEPATIDPNVRAAVSELERVLGTRVRVTEKGKHKGQIEIEYYSDADLDRIYTQIVGE